MRDNPRGLHFERWLHLYGCGLWFHIARDTLTHEIKATYSVDADPPEGLK
jgi:sarcosine oxidase subunit delta